MLFRVLRGLGWGLGGVLGLLVLVLMLFQTEWGATRMVRFVLDRLSLFEGARVEVGRVRGNLLSHLALYDVALIQGDTLRLVQVDTVAARYRLGPLLRKTLHFERIEVVNPAVSMAQQADGSWNLLDVLPADTTAPDTAASVLAVVIDHLRLRGGQARARFHAPGRDSLVALRGLDVRLDSLRVAGDVTARLDTVAGVFIPPGMTTPVSLRLGASLHPDRLDVRGLELTSERSHLVARGILPRFGAPPGPDSLDFTLAADPLHFGDVALFVPTLDPSLELTGTVRAGGTLDLSTLEVTAQVSDGASIRLAGQVTPRLADSLRYRLEARVRGLDLGHYAGPDVDALLNGEMQVDLQGASLDRLDGTLRAVLAGSRVAGRPLDSTTLATQWDDGQVRLELRGGVPGAHLSLTGTARPFAEDPAYDLTAAFRHVDLGVLTGDTTRTSDLAGTLHLAGQGYDPDTADLRARLDLAPGSLNAYRVAGGRLEARLTGGVLTFDTRVAFPEDGVLAFRGEATPGDTLVYTIREGRVENLDYMAALGDTTQSRLSGTFTLRGRGTDPATMTLRAGAHLRATTYDVYRVEEANLRASMRGGTLRFEGDARLGGGTVSLTGRARPFDPTPALAVEEAVFRNLDVGTLAALPGQDTDLNGRLALTLRGFDPATLRLEVRLDLDSSRVNLQPIRRASLTAGWAADTLAYRLMLAVPGGRTELAGTVRDLTGVPVYRVATGRLDALDVGALLGQPAFRTDLNGTFRLEGRGRQPEDLNLEARLDLADSRINDAALPEGQVAVQVREGMARLTSRLALAGGTVDLLAAGRPFEQVPAYTLRGDVQDLDLGQVLGRDTLRAALNLAFAFEGHGAGLGTMQGEGWMQAGATRFHHVTLDTAYARFALAQGLARVDTLVLRSNVLDLHGHGPVALVDTAGVHTTDFTFAVDLVSVAPLRDWVAADPFLLGQGQVEGRLTGPAERLRLDARLDVNSLVYDAMRVAGLRVRLLAELDTNRTVQQAEVRSDIAFFSLPNVSIERTQVSVGYRPEALTFEVTSKLDPRRDGYLGGYVDLVPGRQRLTLDSLRFRFDRDLWRLQQPATLDYAGDTYRVRNLLLYARSPNGTDEITQQIALDGEIDLNGQQSLILTIERFRLGAVTDLFGYEGLGGRLDGWLVLEGAPSAPVADGSLQFDLSLFGETVGDMEATLHYEALQLALESRLTDERGSELLLTGTIPMDLRLVAPDSARTGMYLEARQAAQETVRLDLSTNDFALSWLMPFMDREVVSELDGRLTAELQVRGTFGSPRFDGTLGVRNGRLGLPLLGKSRQGLVYTDIMLDGTFEESRLLLDHVEARSGGGSLIGHGTINFSDLTLGEFDLTFSASDFLAIDSREYRIRTDADLNLRGTTRSPVLSGDVELVSADFFLTEEAAAEFEPVELTEEDQRTLEVRFGLRLTEADTTTFDYYRALTITDLTVRMERDTWLRSKKNPTMDIQFTGNLEVQKAPYEDPLVFGTITVIPERSRIVQFGKRFDIQSGTLTFNGPATDPIMNIQAQYVVRARGTGENEVTITLAVEGRLDNLDVTLGSDPQMEFADIISYLAFGRPAGEALQLGGGGASSSGSGGRPWLDPAAGLALGQIAGLIEDLAGTGLGLDVIEIEQNGLDGATLTAGKYVSPRLYVAVSQPIAFRRSGTTLAEEVPTQVTLEYEIIDRLLIRLLRRGSVIRINLKWEYAY
ncbi:MAG: translocation/assembly module TamB [Rhodothermaceae bacterium]|nr:MAG: translocation/assembly module TamB [Rhodothermaceae bacterium]